MECIVPVMCCYLVKIQHCSELKFDFMCSETKGELVEYVFVKEMTRERGIGELPVDHLVS
jgi:hypothetical protein